MRRTQTLLVSTAFPKQVKEYLDQRGVEQLKWLVAWEVRIPAGTHVVKTPRRRMSASQAQDEKDLDLACQHGLPQLGPGDLDQRGVEKLKWLVSWQVGGDA